MPPRRPRRPARAAYARPTADEQVAGKGDEIGPGRPGRAQITERAQHLTGRPTDEEEHEGAAA